MRALFAVFALFASPAFAGSPCTDLVPPAKYRFEPTIAYSVKRIADVHMTKFCGPPQNAFGRPVLACADRETNTIYVVRNLPEQEWLRCLLIHEKAHLNGWPGSHPRT